MENESIARGYGEPYFVVMGSGTDKTNLGFDALSDYTYSNGSAGGKEYSKFKSKNINTWNGNDYVIDMSGNTEWTGTIKLLRIAPLNPTSGSSSTVEIDYIRLIN